MYFMVTHIAINRVRLPILLVVSWTGKMNISLYAFVPEYLVSRDGFGIPSRISLLISILGLNLGFLLCSAAASIYLYTTAYAIGSEFIGSRNCVSMAFTAFALIGAW